MTPTVTCPLQVQRYGDSALLVSGADDEQLSKETRWAAVHAVAGRLRGAGIRGIEGIVATFETLTVEFDPLELDAFDLGELIRGWSPIPIDPTGTGRVVEIPMVYGGEYGPDLASVASHLGLREHEVIERHSAHLWRVAFTGAPAGTPLHEGATFDAPIPRMPEPRVRIAPGTIALSGHQGTIYTIPAPGGWRLIGRTPLQIINPSGDPFVAIEPGDSLRFRPISEHEFAQAAPAFIGELL